MRILFTGASSFSGMWFVTELASRGHEVVATFQGDAPESYGSGDVRGRRVARLSSCCARRFGVRFGSEQFMDLIRDAGPFDLLCHHAADVTNYKSDDFDVQSAVANNTHNLVAVLRALGRDCRLVLTGSVFEGGEGAGSEGLPHFSAYGLSKALTAATVGYYAPREGTVWGKFVIPNPFGPYEEPRFTAYLVRSWYAGTTPGINTPAYVRDNIHVSLLAKAYAAFAERMSSATEPQRCAPSGYVESQGSFAERFARELTPRLELACPLDPAVQTEFNEPRIRINTEPVDGRALGWDESGAWDELAAYYKKQHGG